MKKILLVLVINALSNLCYSQIKNPVILEKKVASFYYEEHLFAARARQKIETLSNKLEKEKSISNEYLEQISLYKLDSSLYQSNKLNYELIISNKDKIIFGFKDSNKKQKLKIKGLTILLIITSGLLVIK